MTLEAIPPFHLLNVPHVAPARDTVPVRRRGAAVRRVAVATIAAATLLVATIGFAQAAPDAHSRVSDDGAVSRAIPKPGLIIVAVAPKPPGRVPTV